MKQMLFFALLSIVLLLVGCEIGVKQAPKAVRQTFDSMFPDASHVEWERVISNYKAAFYHDRHEKEAQFDPEGVWLRTKTELSFFDVPAPVMETARDYCDWEIDEVLLFEQADGVPAYYLVEYDLERTAREKQLHVLPDGTVMKGF